VPKTGTPAWVWEYVRWVSPSASVRVDSSRIEAGSFTPTAAPKSRKNAADWFALSAPRPGPCPIAAAAPE
jgi:hypothetical protein